MTNVDQLGISSPSVNGDPSYKKGKKKSASTSNTPTSSRESSLTSLVAKLSASDKKKQKSDIKKIKVSCACNRQTYYMYYYSTV